MRGIVETRNARSCGLATFLVAAGMLVLGANASSVTNVTISRVAQRWPWNNKVDITYTVQGGQTRASGVYCGLRFTLTAGGNTYNIEGHTIGASAENGTHTATWTAPQGIVASGCTLSATLFTTNVPSGNDYMIVDIDSGAVAYEGLRVTQDDSNTHYNTATYKTDKLVLRKVPAGGPYPTGYTGFSTNSPTNWMTDVDYYIGVFPVTQYQYTKLYGSNPSVKTIEYPGDTVAHRPVEAVTWNDLRRPIGDSSNFAPTSSIPAVTTANTGTFFQRLNFKTGLYFDLPTEVMFEIAEHAGATTKYSWGEDLDSDYIACTDNSPSNDGKTTTQAVGSHLPNNWGLYDTAGKVFEWCRDQRTNGYSNLANAPDPFTPAWSGGTTRSYRGGAHGGAASTTSEFRASQRQGNESGNWYWFVGFRVSLIAD